MSAVGGIPFGNPSSSPPSNLTQEFNWAGRREHTALPHHFFLVAITPPYVSHLVHVPAIPTSPLRSSSSPPASACSFFGLSPGYAHSLVKVSRLSPFSFCPYSAMHVRCHGNNFFQIFYKIKISDFPNSKFSNKWHKFVHLLFLYI